MKRKCLIFCFAVCLLITLCACEKKPNAPLGSDPAGSVSEAGPEETDPSETEPVSSEAAEAPDPLDLANGEAMREFLCGTWEYPDPVTGAPRVRLEISADGGFFAVRYRDDDDPAEYAGSWTLDRLSAGAHALPDWLCFSPEVSENDMGLFGDFVLAARTVCDGRVMLYLIQVNNGDSVFSFYYDDFTPVLTRADPAAQAVGETQNDVRFYARFWQLSEDGETLWLDDVSAGGGPANEGRFEAVPYCLAENAHVRCEPAGLKPGGSFVEVRTNAAGEITELLPAEISDGFFDDSAEAD